MNINVILDHQKDRLVLSVVKLIEGKEPMIILQHTERYPNNMLYADEYLFKYEGIGAALKFTSAEVDLRPIPNNFQLEAIRYTLKEPFMVSVKPDNTLSQYVDAPNGIEAVLVMFEHVMKSYTLKDMELIFPARYNYPTLQGQFDFLIATLLPHATDYIKRSFDTQTGEDIQW